MNSASVMASYHDAIKILKSSNLYKDINNRRQLTLENSKFSTEFIKISKSEDYDEIFKTALRNSDYDIILIDDSFFQFSCSKGNIDEGVIRYAFYENPRSYPVYEEFLISLGFTYEECGDEFFVDYEQEMEEAKLKRNIMPIRYDYDHRLYDSFKHSISHIHFGHNNETRVSTSTVLNPAKFVSFVVRNVYPKVWNNAFQDDYFRDLCLSAKRACHPVKDNFFDDIERGLLHIT